jgi:hypothetical protein
LTSASSDSAAAPPVPRRFAAAGVLTRSALALAGLVALSAALRIWLGHGVPTPWISPDEMIYGLLGRTLYRSGRLAIENAHSDFYSLVYPALIGGPLAWAGRSTGYELAKALGAVAMSLAAVPAYLWTRAVASTRSALLVAALTLALPAFSYSGLLMTETVFYPLTLLAAWTMVRVLVAPSPQRQLLLVGLVAACVLTRLQGIVLLAVFPLAVVLHGGRMQAARRYAVSFGGLFALVFAWAIWRLVHGGGALGAYSVVASHGYSAGAALRFVLYHVGDLLLLTGFFPAWALVLLWFERRGLDPARRATLAVATSLALLLTLQVGVFAARYVGHLAERDLIAAAPPLFVCLVVWLELGAPRTLRRTAVATLAGLACLFAWPLHTLLTPEALPDSASLIPVFRLVGDQPLGTQQLLIDGVAAAAALALALAPRAFLRLVPLLLVALLAAESVDAERYAVRQARYAQTILLGTQRDWIDRAANGPVSFLYDGASEWNVVWENLFWNRRIDSVLALPRAEVIGPAPGGPVDLAADGTVLLDGKRTSPAYAAAPSSLQLAGSPVAQPGLEAGSTPVALRLWKTERPLRILSRSTGFQPNGDIYKSVTIEAFGCPGVLHLTLISKEEEHLSFYRDGVFWRDRLAKPPQVLSLDLPSAPARHGRCSFGVTTTGLLGSTVVGFEPARSS